MAALDGVVAAPSASVTARRVPRAPHARRGGPGGAAAELPPGEFETALEVLVGETGGLAAAQEADEPLVEGMRGREGVGVLAQGRDLRLLMSALSPEFPSVSRRVRARR